MSRTCRVVLALLTAAAIVGCGKSGSAAKPVVPSGYDSVLISHRLGQPTEQTGKEIKNPVDIASLTDTLNGLPMVKEPQACGFGEDSWILTYGGTEASKLVNVSINLEGCMTVQISEEGGTTTLRQGDAALSEQLTRLIS